jgi:HPt (histidine-containing phosphotransfer) domain-containing protein
MVHALKSALANIGAQELSRAAARLEAAGREADLEAIWEGLPPFREELAALTARIGEISEKAQKGGKSRDDPEAREALAELRKALGAVDVDAIDEALARLQALPLGGRTQAAVSEIADFILGAEFSKAEQTVIALCESSTA